MTKDEAWLLKEKYHGQKTAGFLADCTELTAGVPLAYLIGHIPFLDCTIYLDSRPLIPRTETEFWVKEAIDKIRTETNKLQEYLGARLANERHAMGGFGWGSAGVKESSVPPGIRSQTSILDLCAGSGCIGVAVAKAFPLARVDFAEINPRHLPIIQRNLIENAVAPERCRLIASDLFTDIETRYDYILCNPPYIDQTLKRTEASVATYEPDEALYGGEAGLAYIVKIVSEAPDYLTPNGQLWLEHEPEHTEAIHALATTYGFTAATHHDQYQLERYSSLVLQ